jgi:hypothetical protein
MRPWVWSSTLQKNFLKILWHNLHGSFFIVIHGIMVKLTIKSVVSLVICAKHSPYNFLQGLYTLLPSWFISDFISENFPFAQIALAKCTPCSFESILNTLDSRPLSLPFICLICSHLPPILASWHTHLSHSALCSSNFILTRGLPCKSY